MTQVSGAVTPSSREGHGAVAYGSELFIFGGVDNNGYKNDLYSLDAETVGLLSMTLLIIFLVEVDVAYIRRNQALKPGVPQDGISDRWENRAIRRVQRKYNGFAVN